DPALVRLATRAEPKSERMSLAAASRGTRAAQRVKTRGAVVLRARGDSLGRLPTAHRVECPRQRRHPDPDARRPGPRDGPDRAIGRGEKETLSRCRSGG